jgi:lactate 2-monooxygenase
VHDVLRNLIADIDLTLGLSGCSRFAELRRSNLAKVGSRPTAFVP